MNTMYLKKRILVTLAIVSAFFANGMAQDEWMANDPKSLELSENIMGLSNSPTAQFAKPVLGSSDLYTGVATYNIPLFELKSYNLKVPVSLNYASGGVRVSETGGWLGMSWKLSAGGEISREMKGYPDELPDMGFFVYGDRPRDFESATVSRKKDIIELSQEKYKDMQPDVFHFNFPGGSGYFVFDYDQNIHFVPHRNWIINKTIVDNKITSFNITTDDGIIYSFGGTDAIEETKISTLRAEAYWDFSGSLPNAYYDVPSIKESSLISSFFNSKWYLTSIRSQTGDNITFTYDDAGTLSYVDAPQTMAYETMTGLQWDVEIDPYFGPVAAIKPHLIAYNSLSFRGWNNPDDPWEGYDMWMNCNDPVYIGSYPQCLDEESECVDGRARSKVEFPLRYYFHQNKIENKTRILKEIRASNQNYIDFSSTGASSIPGECRIFKVALMNNSDEEIKSFTFNFEKVISTSANPTGSYPDPFSLLEFYAFKGAKIPKSGSNFVPANNAQDYFSSYTPPNSSLMTKYIIEGLKEYNYERYFLESVHESAGELTKPPYIFSYYAPENIIRRTSAWQGLFSYSRTDHPSQIIMKINEIDAYQITDGLSAAIGTSFGQLTKITLPTGGFVQYEYEPTKDENNLWTLFGVKRVSKIIRNDGKNSYLKTFDYQGIGHEAKRSYSRSISFLDLVNATENRMRISTSYNLEGVSYTKGSPIGYDVVEVKNYEDAEGTSNKGYERFEFTSLKIEEGASEVTDIVGLTSANIFGETFTYPVSYNLIKKCLLFDPDQSNDPSYKVIERSAEITNDFYKSDYGYSSLRDNARGLLKKHTVFKGTQIIKETINTYSNTDFSNVKGLNGRSFNFGRQKLVGDDGCVFGVCHNDWDSHPLRKKIANISVHYSSIITLTSKSEIIYDANFPGDKTKAIATLTEYTYNERKQIEDMIKYDAGYVGENIKKIDGNDTYKTEYRYADEFTDDTYANVLLLRNILVPLEKINYKNNDIIGSSLTQYLPVNGSIWGGFAVLPRFGYKLEIDGPINQSTYTRGTSFTNLDSRCKSKAEYFYDDYFNIRQVLDIDKDYRTCYIWAYNHSYPVAKIENFNYDNLSTALGNVGSSLENIETVSMGDNDEEDLIAVFNSLRNDNSMKDALISSYTYDPFIGVKSETDPSGKTIFYQYDDLGRLMLITNEKGEILKKYEYNYKMSE